MTISAGKVEEGWTHYHLNRYNSGEGYIVEEGWTHYHLTRYLQQWRGVPVTLSTDMVEEG